MTALGRWRIVGAVLAAGTAAGVLTLAANRAGLFDMALMAGCGPGLLQASLAMALRMAVAMTVIGILTARPRLLCSRHGAMVLVAWVLGLTVFAVTDSQAATASLALPDPRLSWLLGMAPLLAGLLAAALVPRGQKLCLAIMIVMVHAGLMTWPWMAGCAALTAWTELRGRTCGLHPARRTALSL